MKNCIVEFSFHEGSSNFVGPFERTEAMHFVRVWENRTNPKVKSIVVRYLEEPRTPDQCRVPKHAA